MPYLKSGMDDKEAFRVFADLRFLASFFFKIAACKMLFPVKRSFEPTSPGEGGLEVEVVAGTLWLVEATLFLGVLRPEICKHFLSINQ